MSKHYPWLCFDADNTLFDYNRAEANALNSTFHALGLHFDVGYVNIYQDVNSSLWKAFERREITPELLRVRRFESLLEAIQVNASPDEMSRAYVEQLALCTDLMDGAYDVLQSLHKVSRILIVTNGLSSVQRGRMSRSAIQEFITELVISEEIGVAKPHAGYFDVAFVRMGNPARGDVLIIGDSLTSDICGGLDYGIDTCWFNPNTEPRPDGLQITYEIRNLRELLVLLD